MAFRRKHDPKPETEAAAPEESVPSGAAAEAPVEEPITKPDTPAAIEELSDVVKVQMTQRAGLNGVMLEPGQILEVKKEQLLAGAFAHYCKVIK